MFAHNLPFLVFSQFESRSAALGSSMSVEWRSVKGAFFFSLAFFWVVVFGFVFFTPRTHEQNSRQFTDEIITVHRKAVGYVAMRSLGQFDIN